MGNVYMEADQVRFKNSTYHNLQTAVAAALEGGGGGGTTVVANPEGIATADLSKLQVGTTIYGIPADAADISYNNTTSGMTADDVQDAIDELNAAIPGVATTSAPGIVQPDGTTITIADGVISAAGGGSGNVQYNETSEIGLSGLTWSASIGGMYYATVENAYPSNKTPIGFLLVDWSNLRTEDKFMFAQSTSTPGNITILSANNTFSGNLAMIKLRIAYI